MYKIIHSQLSIENIYLSYQYTIFDKREKLVMQPTENYIFDNFNLLKQYKDKIFILESHISLYCVLKALKKFNILILINGIFNPFENEFLKQVAERNNFEITNFMY